MGLFDKVMGKFYVDGVEIKGMQNAVLEVETDRPEYETVKLPNLTDISLNATFTVSRQNGKTGLAWEIVRARSLKLLAEYEAKDKRSKQIRRSSYRKTKSQRRRG